MKCVTGGIEGCMKRRREENFDYALILLPVLVLQTSLVNLNPLNGDNSLLGGKETCCGRGVGKIEPDVSRRSINVSNCYMEGGEKI